MIGIRARRAGLRDDRPCLFGPWFRLAAMLAPTLLLASSLPALGQQLVPVDSQRIIGSTAQAGDAFGSCVSSSGSHAIVVASHNEIAGPVGFVFFFERDGAGVWSEVAVFAEADLGITGIEPKCDMDGTRAVVAGAETVGDDRMSVHVFELDAGSWSLVDEVGLPGTIEPTTIFDVDLSGDDLLVGGRVGTTGGAGYPFRRISGVWVQIGLLAPVGVPTIQILNPGRSVAIDGATAVLGAPDSSTLAGTEAGVAVVFGFDGVSWSQQEILVASDADDHNEFGSAVDVDGDRIVVGQIIDLDPPRHTGSVYVFDRVGSTWVESVRLFANDVEESARLGNSVDVDGDLVAAGAYLHDGPFNSGAVYLFAQGPSGWFQAARFKALASLPLASDHLGSSVSLGSDFVLAGAPQETTNGTGFVESVTFGPAPPPTVPSGDGVGVILLVLSLLALGGWGVPRLSPRRSP